MPGLPPRLRTLFRHVRQIWQTRSRRSQHRFALAETVILTAIVLGCAWAVDRRDPLDLHAGFAWIWLLPMIIALRYGTLFGLLSGAMLFGFWKQFPVPSHAAPQDFFIGGLLQTILAGHFSDIWHARRAKADALNGYLNERLVSITNRHFLVRASHERLEKEFLSKPTTMRDAFAELRHLSIDPDMASAPAGGPHAVDDHDDDTKLPGAQALLEFVALASQIEVAALYPVVNGKIRSAAIASVGGEFDLDRTDILVKQAIAHKEIAHLRNVEGPVKDAQYLVCAPLLSADGRFPALLVVKRMPFLSLNFDNLQMLLIVLCYYTDGVSYSSTARRIIAEQPDCPPEFALDIARLSRLQPQVGTSSLLLMSFPANDAGRLWLDYVASQRRALDLIWTVVQPTRLLLVTLMPLTDFDGIKGYRTRIEKQLASRFDVDVQRSDFFMHAATLDASAPATVLPRLLQLGATRV